MQTLGLTTKPTAEEEYSSLLEQRSLAFSLKTQKADWTFGVGLPLLCVVADPIVFSGHGSLLGDYTIFAYALSSVSIFAMAGWLLLGDRLGWVRPFLGGFFVAGSAVSAAVGLFILPYSIMGMFLLIGFLGFTPMISAWVFFRNGLKAIRNAEAEMDRRYVWRAALLAAIWGTAVPFVLNLYKW